MDFALILLFLVFVVFWDKKNYSKNFERPYLKNLDNLFFWNIVQPFGPKTNLPTFEIGEGSACR